eukprot:symbB.v1.2.019117.t1/scaffold1544.1/size112707/8
MELRAREMVYEAAQVEGAAFSWNRFVGWLTGRPDHPIRLPLVQHWHAISKSVMDHGYTMGEVCMIFVCLLCIMVVACVLWPPRRRVSMPTTP